MKTIKVTRTKVKTLKEVAKILKISESKASEIKKKIESDIGAPSYMVWGTGTQKGYLLSSFGKKIGIKVEKK
ncbi:hypothetical protein [Flavobacterium fluviatile]|uniref:hypothetical protein n=1 Tax=Flavobacterium fluviatile TaxID=1862387 RepID=UPI0013D59A38|nr:hypothetical protein [Flavobacterium fluviatile]